MKIKDKIVFKHGVLEKGDICMRGASLVVYLGSFKSKGMWHHMFHSDEDSVQDMMYIDNDLRLISSSKQVPQPDENQMELTYG